MRHSKETKEDKKGREGALVPPDPQERVEDGASAHPRGYATPQRGNGAVAEESSAVFSWCSRYFWD